MRALLMIVVLAAALSGCQRQAAMTDLQALVAETDAPVSAKLAAAASAKAGRKIQYAAQDKRSPFQNPLTSTSPPPVLPPSALTSPEPIGRVDRARSTVMKLDELTLVGTLSGIHRSSVQALFRDGDGYIHRLSVGDEIGANSARIVAVSETRVELLEKVPQEDGGWIVQPRTFLLSQQKPLDF